MGTGAKYSRQWSIRSRSTWRNNILFFFTRFETRPGSLHRYNLSEGSLLGSRWTPKVRNRSESFRKGTVQVREEHTRLPPPVPQSNRNNAENRCLRLLKSHATRPGVYAISTCSIRMAQTVICSAVAMSLNAEVRDECRSVSAIVAHSLTYLLVRSDAFWRNIIDRSHSLRHCLSEA
jgi:hypothetical protein